MATGIKGRNSKSTETESKSSICTICDKTVEMGEKGIECEACVKWFHPECQKMSADAYKTYKEYKQLHWYCAQCNKGIAKLYTLLNEMSVRQDGFEKSLKQLRKDTRNIDSMKKTLDTLSVDVKGLNDKLDLTSQR